MLSEAQGLPDAPGKQASPEVAGDKSTMTRAYGFQAGAIQQNLTIKGP